MRLTKAAAHLNQLHAVLQRLNIVGIFSFKKNWPSWSQKNYITTKIFFYCHCQTKTFLLWQFCGFPNWALCSATWSMVWTFWSCALHNSYRFIYCLNTFTFSQSLYSGFDVIVCLLTKNVGQNKTIIFVVNLCRSHWIVVSCKSLWNGMPRQRI